MAGVGHHEHVVAAPEEHVAAPLHHVGEHAEELPLQGILGHAVVVVEARLGPPADVEGGVDMALAPLHDPAQLRPVFHLLKGQVLHRRAGDDHAVVVVLLHVREVAVKGQHVLLGGVLGHVALGADELQLHLEGRVGQQAAELGLRGDLGGHQVQQQDPQGPDVLGGGPGLRHDEDVFLLQGPGGGQLVGDSNGHGFTSML